MNIFERNKAALERSKARRLEKARTRVVTVDGEKYTLKRPPLAIILEKEQDKDVMVGSLEWAVHMALVCLELDPEDEENRESLMDLLTLEGGEQIIESLTDMVIMRTKKDSKAKGGAKERQDEQEAQENEERPLEP